MATITETKTAAVQPSTVQLEFEVDVHRLAIAGAGYGARFPASDVVEYVSHCRRCERHRSVGRIPPTP